MYLLKYDFRISTISFSYLLFMCLLRKYLLSVLYASHTLLATTDINQKMKDSAGILSLGLRHLCNVHGAQNFVLRQFC